MAERFASHVAALAQAGGVTIDSHSSGGRAWRKTKRIAIRPVLSSVTYAIALHELGHVLAPDGAKGNRLDKEVAAWRWAREQALDWDDRMEAARSKRLASYVRWAQRRQRADPRGRTFITPTHPVWRYVEA